MRIMFAKFHYFASLPHIFVSYFLTFISKVKNPSSLGEFRHISLVGSQYKLVAKVLAKRLGLVMHKLISPNQSTFLKGRVLVVGVMVANELIDLAKRTKNACLIFKVDFEKAYDSVSWSFLIYMLIKFSFSDKCRS